MGRGEEAGGGGEEAVDAGQPGRSVRSHHTPLVPVPGSSWLIRLLLMCAGLTRVRAIVRRMEGMATQLDALSHTVVQMEARLTALEHRPTPS